ncbi:hypothetical protein PQI23_13315 [Leucobacter sp. USCH14]|uniref:hypothetical protein n=1 Tax=Leucobacter sp. USCH14 TaxID=3024838 RepID=UPI0030AF2A13
MSMFGPWQIRYPGTEYVFGMLVHDVEVIDWEQDADAVEVEDVRPAGADGLWMGRDTIEPGAVTVHVKIDFSSKPWPIKERVRRAMEVRSELARVWRADAVRSTNGELAELTLGGSVVIEGRPRRPQFDDVDQSVGLIFADLPFIPASVEAFPVREDGGTWHSVEVGIVAPVGRSGWVFPLVFPIQNLEPDVRSTWFEVAGDIDASCIVSVYGPLQAGAEVEIASGFKLVTKRDLAYDEVAVADARPGRMTLTVNGEPSNFIAPTSARLAELKLTPGPHQVSLRGISPQGTARARIEWRDTKAGI